MRCQKASIAIYDHGAHLASWVPAGQRDVLWMSDRTEYDHEKALRGGVPICFPWFAAGPSGDRQPSHGNARLANWDLVDSEIDDEHIQVRYRYHDPCGASAELAVTAGLSLTIALSVTAGDTDVDVEAALHSYFSVTDVSTISILGLDGVDYHDKVRDRADIQRGELSFPGEVDRIYATEQDIRIVDTDRTILIARENSAQAVVWNPGSGADGSMSDISTDGWRGFVCVESANVKDSSLHLTAGTEHTMTTTVSVSPQLFPS